METIGQLDRLLKGLIAEQEGVSEEAITCERIHLWREEKIYPEIRRELEELERRGDRFLEKMTRPKKLRRWRR